MQGATYFVRDMILGPTVLAKTNVLTAVLTNTVLRDGPLEK